MASIAVPTPSSYAATEYSGRGNTKLSTHRANLLADGLRSLYLSGIMSRRDKSFSQALHSKLANSSPNPQSLHAICPEELIAEEGLDDCRNAGYTQLSRGTTRKTSEHLPRRLAPVVPAPPWWQAASICLKSQSWGTEEMG